MTVKINNVHLLPKDWSFTTLDVAGDYYLRTPIITCGMGTKLGKVQCMIMHECKVRNDIMIEKAMNFLSDHHTKGWNAAVPIMDWVVRKKIIEYKNDGKQLKMICWRSDRGPHDYWCQPAYVYSSDIGKKYKIKMKHDTTASQHSKSHHDQIICTVNGFSDRSSIRIGG